MWPYVYIGTRPQVSLMNLKRVVSSKDIIYNKTLVSRSQTETTKTHGHQLLVDTLYAEEKMAIHATDIAWHHFTTYYQKEIISLEKFRSYYLIRENAKLFHLEQFAIYSNHW